MVRIDHNVTDENGGGLVDKLLEIGDKYPTPTLAETDEEVGEEEEEGGAMETMSGGGGDGTEKYGWICGTLGYGEPRRETCLVRSISVTEGLIIILTIADFEDVEDVEDEHIEREVKCCWEGGSNSALR